MTDIMIGTMIGTIVETDIIGIAVEGVLGGLRLAKSVRSFHSPEGAERVKTVTFCIFL